MQFYPLLAFLAFPGDKSLSGRTEQLDPGYSSSWPCCRCDESRSNTWRTSLHSCWERRPLLSPPASLPWGRDVAGPGSRLSQTTDWLPCCQARQLQRSGDHSLYWTNRSIFSNALFKPTTIIFCSELSLKTHSEMELLRPGPGLNAPWEMVRPDVNLKWNG